MKKKKCENYCPKWRRKMKKELAKYLADYLRTEFDRQEHDDIFSFNIFEQGIEEFEKTRNVKIRFLE